LTRKRKIQEEGSRAVVGGKTDGNLRPATPQSAAAWGFDAADWDGAGIATLAVLEGDALEHVERDLGRRVGWRRTGVGLREAVGRALS